MRKNEMSTVPRMIRWLLYATIFLAPLFSDFLYGPLLMAVVLAGYDWIKRGHRIFRVGPLRYVGLVFLLVSLVSVVQSPSPSFSFFNWMALPLAYALFYVLIVSYVREEGDIKTAISVFFVATFCVVLYGIVQYVDIRHMATDLTVQAWADPERFPLLYRRMYSTLENPNLLGAYVVMLLSMSSVFFFFVQDKRAKVVLGLLSGILLVCLLLTYSRGAWFSGLLICIGLIFFCEKRLAWLLLLLPAFLWGYHGQITERVFSLFSGEDTSISLRFALWESTRAMIVDHPWLGIGWGAYWLVYPTYNFFIENPSVIIYHAHNMMLHVWAEIGIFGGTVYLGLFVVQLAHFLRCRNGKIHMIGQAARIAGILMTVAIVVMSLGDHILFSRAISFCFWGLSAVCFSATRLSIS